MGQHRAFACHCCTPSACAPASPKGRQQVGTKNLCRLFKGTLVVGPTNNHTCALLFTAPSAFSLHGPTSRPSQKELTSPAPSATSTPIPATTWQCTAASASLHVPYQTATGPTRKKARCGGTCNLTRVTSARTPGTSTAVTDPPSLLPTPAREEWLSVTRRAQPLTCGRSPPPQRDTTRRNRHTQACPHFSRRWRRTRSMASLGARRQAARPGGQPQPQRPRVSSPPV